jgi:hypothetical protein
MERIYYRSERKIAVLTIQQIDGERQAHYLPAMERVAQKILKRILLHNINI